MALPDLEGWAIFAKVAETGSFAKTAAALELSQSTVSKAVTRLETRLKTVLFHRTSRRMALTESGRGALERAARILHEGEAVEAELTAQSPRPRGNVRMAVPMSFGLAHVAPALPAFMAAQPEISLDVQFSDAMTDLVGGGFDLALRIAALENSSLLARRLCGVRLLCVGSPAYFAAHGRPDHPRDLSGHRALAYTGSRAGNAWRFRHAQQGDFAIAVPSPLRVNNADALTPALLAGLGVALQPEFLVWRELRDGLLEAVLTDWVPPPIALHIVTPPGRQRPARVDLLIEYLAATFARSPWASAA